MKIHSHTPAGDASIGERRVPGLDAAWSLRPCQPHDRTAIQDLLRRAKLPHDGLEAFFNSTFVLAQAGTDIIGSVGIEVYGRYGLVRSLAVAPEWQGMAIGRALLQDRLAWAKSRGLIAVFLLTLESDYFARFDFKRVARDSVPPEVRRSAEFSSICPETATVMALPMNYSDEDLRNGVRAKYAAIASEVKDRSTNEGNKTRASCCQPSSCGASENPITSGLYSDDELADVPDDAALASLGCGNPTALAALQPGDVVLDLGSGGGIDVILSARRVAPGGKAYGLDMTDEMLDIARQNQKQAGITNAEFLKGHIEDIPLADGAVDVVISNCVINLSTDKRKTLSEALRVLKPGGRFAVSDIVSTGPVPESVRRDAELWAGCLAGSLEEGEYRRLLQEVGFEEIDIKPTRIYDAANFCGGDANADTKESGKTNSITGLFMGAFVEARKPNR